jgi:hypothetical protein
MVSNTPTHLKKLGMSPHLMACHCLALMLNKNKVNSSS